jgi:hypothetical protein
MTPFALARRKQIAAACCVSSLAAVLLFLFVGSKLATDGSCTINPQAISQSRAISVQWLPADHFRHSECVEANTTTGALLQ